MIEIDFSASIVETIEFDGAKILLKRDDLLHQDFSGNKARKLLYFLGYNNPRIKRVISYGSNQSNAMYSLSVLAQMKSWEFYYYTHHIPSFLQNNPCGNYKYALQNGMKIFTASLPTHFNDDELFIKEGGAIKEAELGVKMLALELEKFENCDIFLPSGTGTTALYLQKHLKQQVYTCACVADKHYLQKQFFELEGDKKLHPIIVDTPKKYHFGKLHLELFELWQDVCNQTQVVFDLLYDPIGWACVLHHNLHKQKRKLLYIHQGGVLGNESLLERYKRKINT